MSNLKSMMRVLYIFSSSALLDPKCLWFDISKIFVKVGYKGAFSISLFGHMLFLETFLLLQLVDILVRPLLYKI